MKEEVMSGDYLWDGSGPRDAEVAHLEGVLGGLRHSGSPPRLAAEPEESEKVEPVVIRKRWLAIAALVGLTVMASWAAWIGRPAQVASGPSLAVEDITGEPRIAAVVAKGNARLGVGQWLQTDAKSSARIAVGTIGHVTVEPNSRLQLKSTGENEHLLDLARGSIAAKIYAPPRVFLVDMPSARAVDMGCEYRLDVREDGAGVLRVTLGHVLLVKDGRESDVVMFASCRTRPGVGPGTPYFDDAAPEFAAELEKLDFERGGERSLATVIAKAREKDALSLFHLFKRLSGSQKGAVFEKLVVLKPLPEMVTKEAVFAGDEGALSRWWDHMRPF
jgi:hypothetical protein